MPTLFVSPIPLPFPARLEPEEAHDASYFAASARTASLRRISICTTANGTLTLRTEAQPVHVGFPQSSVSHFTRLAGEGGVFTIPAMPNAQPPVIILPDGGARMDAFNE